VATKRVFDKEADKTDRLYTKVSLTGFALAGTRTHALRAVYRLFSKDATEWHKSRP